MRRLCWEEDRGVARLPQRQTSLTAADWPAGGRINQTHMRARTHTRTHRLVYFPECMITCRLNLQKLLQGADFSAAIMTLSLVVVYLCAAMAVHVLLSCYCHVSVFTGERVLIPHHRTSNRARRLLHVGAPA